jgi:5-methylcytosine-specific restriction endonuclease McrA
VNNSERRRIINIHTRARRRRRDPNADLTAAQWLTLLVATRGRCQYCLRVMEPNEITVDHVEPNRNYGSLTLANIVPACVSCNHGAGGKLAKTVEQWLPSRRAAAFRRRHAKLLTRALALLQVAA